jgi:hypothetical protein
MHRLLYTSQEPVIQEEENCYSFTHRQTALECLHVESYFVIFHFAPFDPIKIKNKIVREHIPT